MIAVTRPSHFNGIGSIISSDYGMNGGAVCGGGGNPGSFLNSLEWGPLPWNGVLSPLVSK